MRVAELLGELLDRWLGGAARGERAVILTRSTVTAMSLGEDELVRSVPEGERVSTHAAELLQFALGGEVPGLNRAARAEFRSAVEVFAAGMEGRLREFDHLGPWDRTPALYLLERLDSKREQLGDACSDAERLADVVEHATDVGNYAMMLADNARRALARLNTGDLDFDLSDGEQLERGR